MVAGVSTTPAAASTTVRPGSGTPAASVPGSLSGTLTIGEREYFQPTMTQLVKAYEKYRPGVTVQVQELPNDNTYQTKLLTEKLAGSLPDIIATYDVLSPTLTTQGIEANLTPYLNSADLYPQSYWLSNFLASYIMDSGPDTGQVHALPMEADATVIYYNEKEFGAAGVPFPTPTWTWNQMLADAKKLEKSSGGKQVQWGIADTPDWQAVYNPLIKDYGGTAFGPKSAGLGSGPPEGVGDADRPDHGRPRRSVLYIRGGRLQRRNLVPRGASGDVHRGARSAARRPLGHSGQVQVQRCGHAVHPARQEADRCRQRWLGAHQPRQEHQVIARFPALAVLGVGWDANPGSLLRRGASRTLAVRAERAVAQAAGATGERGRLRDRSVSGAGRSPGPRCPVSTQRPPTSPRRSSQSSIVARASPTPSRHSTRRLTLPTPRPADGPALNPRNVPALGLTRLRAQERPRPRFKRISKIQERANMAIVAESGVLVGAEHASSGRRGAGTDWANRDRRAALTMLAPNFILFTIFVGVPVITGFLLSFCNWGLVGWPHWAGLANYRQLFHDPTVPAAIVNTLLFVAIGVVPTVLIGLLLAVFINIRARR